jgi:hypothetical protein
MFFFHTFKHFYSHIIVVQGVHCDISVSFKASVSYLKFECIENCCNKLNMVIFYPANSDIGSVLSLF